MTIADNNLHGSSLARNSSDPGGRIRVVFPGGAVYEDGTWTVAYGIHDSCGAVRQLVHKELVANCSDRNFV